jgi:hypothetical protein
VEKITLNKREVEILLDALEIQTSIHRLTKKSDTDTAHKLYKTLVELKTKYN